MQDEKVEKLTGIQNAFIQKDEAYELLSVDSDYQNQKIAKNKQMNTQALNRYLSIMEKPQIRIAVACLLIKNMSNEDILRLINGRFETSYTKRTIDLFRKHSFSIISMSKNHWIDYLKSCSPSERNMLILAMNEPEERLKHELELKSKLDYSTILNDMMLTSYYKYKDIMKKPKATASEFKTASGLARIVFEAGDRKEKYAQGDMEDFAEQVQMQFVFERENFPSAQGVTGGNIG